MIADWTFCLLQNSNVDPIKATTEVNVVIKQLQDKLYSCPDRFGLKDRLAAENVTMNNGAGKKMLAFFS